MHPPPLTELDHYVAGAIQLDRIIYDNATSSIAVGAGVQYTDFKWTAYGGSGIYSSAGGFRNNAWKDPDWVSDKLTPSGVRCVGRCIADRRFTNCELLCLRLALELETSI
ncbi:hypothetical protein [Rhizobium indigoferae]|uniref:hypothetical protein n=1 Tax=Rhizobium indigoferae TaxID=158891 RepID=UPI00389A2A96